MHIYSEFSLSNRWFHIKVSLITCIGFFTDAYVHRYSCAKHVLIDPISYNIFAINIASVIGYVYGSGGPYFTYVNAPASLIESISCRYSTPGVDH